MNRRDFILLASAAALTVPHPARAEEPVKKIGWLSGLGPQQRLYGEDQDALRRGLKELGWTEGENYQIELRASVGDPHRFADFAAALVRSRQDIILVSGGETAIRDLQRETKTLPVLFLGGLIDPVGSKVVASLERPGGNITGVSDFSAKMGAAWVQTLKDLGPKLTRVGILTAADDPGRATLKLFQSTIEDAAKKHRLKVSVIEVASDADVTSAIAAFGEKPGASLIVLPEIGNVAHFQSIIAATASARVPAIYGYSLFPRNGGLVSYAADPADAFYRAGPYIDRILKGASPGDLPVLEAAKFDLVINTKTAAALDITVPPALRSRASEVVE